MVGANLVFALLRPVSPVGQSQGSPLQTRAVAEDCLYDEASSMTDTDSVLTS